MKSFDDARAYEREIERLVPGYELVHQLVPSLLRAHLGQETARRVLVVGCGTGHELLSLAACGQAWFIDGLDPAASMLATARATLRGSDAEDRVQLFQGRLEGFSPGYPYDAVVATLVAHFVPDDGARAAFTAALARLLRPGGVALTVDVVDDGALAPLFTQAHLDWSQGRGVDDDRLSTMAHRLGQGFASLDETRHRQLCHEAGLRIEHAFFRAFGVVGTMLSRPPAW